jgi:IclR family transcriptional regulator, acetate operon repressor
MRALAQADMRQDDGRIAPPRAPHRAMQVIEHLASERNGLSLAALSIALALPKTSLLQLLRALEGTGYVQRHDGAYVLGPASFRMGTLITSNSSAITAGRGILQNLLEQSGESVLLGTFTADGKFGVYTERLESPHVIRFAPAVGEQRPLYCTGLGKALLAFSPAPMAAEYMRTLKLHRFTKHTLASKAALAEELTKIRQRGVAISIEEMIEGGAAVAAPVFEAGGNLRACVVIAAPAARMRARAAELEKLARDAGERLSQVLGFLGNYPGQR